MKEKILIGIICFLVGAVLSTGLFLGYTVVNNISECNKTKTTEVSGNQGQMPGGNNSQNSQNNNNQPPEMPSGENNQNNGNTPPEKPDTNNNNSNSNNNSTNNNNA
ncbi:MAG: hypothetical protein IJI43_03765 [Bacilli bacterium]|nr:hypothetical protein [Bacilli bacterium]